jgi:PKD repeat protein
VGIVNSTWRFFYDGELISLHGETASYFFEIPGIYDVTLTVRDGAGKSATAIVQVTVSDTEPPVAVMGELDDPEQGERVTLDGSSSTDNVGIVEWEWTIERDGSSKVLEGSVVRFTFSEPGRYEVTMKVTDAEGLSSTDQSTVRVEATQESDGYLLYGVLGLAIVIAASLIFWRRG